MSSSASFKTFSEKFLNKYFDLNPGTAVYLGLHEYDSQLPDLSQEGIDNAINIFQDFKNELSEINSSELSPKEQYDYDILKWTIDSYLFGSKEILSYKNNPMVYTYAFGSINSIIGKNYAPFETRAKSVIEIMKKVPSVFDNAYKNLDKIVPSVFCKYALGFCTGYINFFEHDLKKAIEDEESIDDDTRSELLNEYHKHVDEALTAFRKYIHFIEDTLMPSSDDSYPLGKDKFLGMLKYDEQIEIPLEELKSMGEKELSALKEKLNDLIIRHDLAGKLDKIEEEHPTEENLISETENTLTELIEFIKEKDLVDFPEQMNCKAIEMPEFMNIGFAAMGTAGPFEDSDESFYYVNLPNKEWDQAQKDEWLSLFNYPTLKLISIHEAFPGHYVHIATSYEKASKIANIFMSYSYLEGWAHYTEEMMIDEGFDIDDPKVRYAQLKEALIRCCRYLVAIGLHTEDMTIDQGTEFFMKNAHMNETTARQEAERGAYDAGYINYTLGKIILKQLKDKYFKEYSGSRTTKDFHNMIISNGAPTFRIAEKYLLHS
jgi:uncharacterized protein (DUF885 family)